jgi:hypothetical protein
MCADQKIGGDPFAWAATRSIPPPSRRRPESGRFGHRQERCRQLAHRVLKTPSIPKDGGSLGPDYFRRDQRPFLQRCNLSAEPDANFESAPKTSSSTLVINRGDHGRRRSRAIIASVSIFLPRQPYTSLTGSALVLLIAISRPCSSLNSSTVPGVTPSQSLSRFGIVTWPRSATRAFILFMYGHMEDYHNWLKPAAQALALRRKHFTLIPIVMPRPIWKREVRPGLIAPLRRYVQQLVRPKESLAAARIRGVGVKDRALRVLVEDA